MFQSSKNDATKRTSFATTIMTGSLRVKNGAMSLSMPNIKRVAER